MKNVICIAIAAITMFGCKNEAKKGVENETTEAVAMNYTTFGDEITATDVQSQTEMVEKYKNLKPGDTVPVKFTTGVKEVCQNKGCWMKVNMGDTEAMVKFKDYGFFMPKDIAGQEIIIEGVAFVEEMSVEDQRHFAEDAGKPKDEIAAITEPKRTLSVLSNGVLIPQKQ